MCTVYQELKKYISGNISDTPINKTPTISNKDVSLYRLFRVVQNFGGYNRVTNQVKWKVVYAKMGLPNCNAGVSQIKSIYKK